MSDARQIIFDEIIGKIPGQKKLAGDAYMIVCPYHADRTPSCGINLTVDSKVPLGYFHCLGCGEKGHWNKLAEHMGLEKLKDWELGFTGNGSKRRDRKQKVVIYETGREQLKRSLYTEEMIDWPANRMWRGYNGDIIRALGGLFYNDKLTDEVMLFFPVSINGKFKGGVRAYLEKVVGGLSYLTTKGAWVKDAGLLGYEYSKKLVRERHYTGVVLVEGPRDMLRLISNGIPAVAILGVENYTQRKLLRILAMSSNISTIYVMPDNDKAGTRMFKTIKSISSDLAEVKHLKLPREYDKKGKLIKMDPDNCDQEIIDQVKKLLIKTRRKKKKEE